jgi:hypothetical protein
MSSVSAKNHYQDDAQVAPCRAWQERFPIKTAAETRKVVHDLILSRFGADVISPENSLTYELNRSNSGPGWKDFISLSIKEYDKRLFQHSLSHYLATRHMRIQVKLVNGWGSAEEEPYAMEDDSVDIETSNDAMFNTKVAQFSLHLDVAMLLKAADTFETARTLMVCGVACKNWIDVFLVNIECQLALLLTYTICTRVESGDSHTQDAQHFALQMFELQPKAFSTYDKCECRKDVQRLRACSSCNSYLQQRHTPSDGRIGGYYSTNV